MHIHILLLCPQEWTWKEAKWVQNKEVSKAQLLGPTFPWGLLHLKAVGVFHNLTPIVHLLFPEEADLAKITDDKTKREHDNPKWRTAAKPLIIVIIVLFQRHVHLGSLTRRDEPMSLLFWRVHPPFSYVAKYWQISTTLVLSKAPISKLGGVPPKWDMD